MSAHLPFAGRHVVVTGGTGSLGTAVVSALLDGGATCHVPWLAEREVPRFTHRDHAHVHLSGPLQLTDEAAVVGYYASLPEVWASIHIAGGFAMAALTETSLAELRRMVDMNLVTAFLACREATVAIRRSGQAGGRLVNVAARPAVAPVGGMLAYSTSKAAVASLTVCAAEELACEDIWVNAVVPSIMDTAANRAAMPDADHAAWPSVEDVAQTIVFLASPDNRVTRGAVVPVYGRS